MRRRLVLGLVMLMLAGVWMLALTSGSFVTHMIAHMTAVAVAAPLLALELGRPRWLMTPMAALGACAVELVVVWGWHAPSLHAAAKDSIAVFAVEQTSFLLAGYAVWASALPPRAPGGSPGLAGVGAMLATSMHMTLLGGLLAVSSNAWYHHGEHALADQQLGGVIMLAGGGIAYLAGAIALLGSALSGASRSSEPS